MQIFGVYLTVLLAAIAGAGAAQTMRRLNPTCMRPNVASDRSCE